MFHKIALILSLTYPAYALARADDQFLEDLRAGESLIATHQFEKAIASCRNGLMRLGHEYSSPTLLDDSGTKLIAAAILEKEGKLENAATMICRILKERAELLKVKRNAKDSGPAKQ